MSNRYSLILLLESKNFAQRFKHLMSNLRSDPKHWQMQLHDQGFSELQKVAHDLAHKRSPAKGSLHFNVILQSPESDQNTIYCSVWSRSDCQIAGQQHLLFKVGLPEWHADDPDQLILKPFMPAFYTLFDLLEPTFGRCISEIEESEWYSQNQDSGIWMGDLISLPSPFFVFHHKLWMQLQEKLPELVKDLVSVTALEKVVVVVDRDLTDPRLPEDPEQQHLHQEALYRISRFVRCGGLES